MARAFLAVLDAPCELIHNESFNVGRTGENYRVREMAQIVAEVVPDSFVEFADGAGPDKRNYRVNCDKIVNTLPGFEPTWTAREGAKELYQAYKRVGLKQDEFEGPRYRRIHHVKKLIREGQLDENLRWVQRERSIPTRGD
jgi:nucleoside-diphosphate-sugar epimerase